MKKYQNILVATALIFTISSCKVIENKPEKTSANTLSFVKTKGTQLVAANGNSIILKGTNLGHWLVPEGYMFKMNQVNSPRKIDELFYELVGPDSLQVLWTSFLNNYITHDDIKYLKSIGSNHIRLPFHYKMFTDDLYMGERNAGFKYLILQV